jgi:hypothetical protein
LLTSMPPNSEYSITTTRKIITGGLKGYERMLSKSRNRNEPGWKPLHMPASFKSKERRTAKMLAKANWFKSRQEQGKDVQNDPVRTEGRKVRNPAGSSLEESPMTINASRMGMEEGGMNVLTGSLSGNKSGSKKMRGPERPTLSLGGRKRLEKATRKKERRRVNRQLGRAGVSRDHPEGKKLSTGNRNKSQP